MNGEQVFVAVDRQSTIVLSTRNKIEEQRRMKKHPIISVFIATIIICHVRGGAVRWRGAYRPSYTAGCGERILHDESDPTIMMRSQYNSMRQM